MKWLQKFYEGVRCRRPEKQDQQTFKKNMTFCLALFSVFFSLTLHDGWEIEGLLFIDGVALQTHVHQFLFMAMWL